MTAGSAGRAVTESPAVAEVAVVIGAVNVTVVVAARGQRDHQEDNYQGFDMTTASQAGQDLPPTVEDTRKTNE